PIVSHAADTIALLLELPPRSERRELLFGPPRLDASVSQRGDLSAQPLLLCGYVRCHLRVGASLDEHAAIDSLLRERCRDDVAKQLAFERVHADVRIAERIGVDDAADDHG